jgi:hypothetical protein
LGSSQTAREGAGILIRSGGVHDRLYEAGQAIFK